MELLSPSVSMCYARFVYMRIEFYSGRGEGLHSNYYWADCKNGNTFLVIYLCIHFGRDDTFVQGVRAESLTC